MEWIQAIAAIASGLAAVLAWVAKIRWSNEFAAAKDETIRAKEAQMNVKDERISDLKEKIEWLRQFNPQSIQENYISAINQLDEINSHLNREIEELKMEVANRDSLLSELSESKSEDQMRIENLTKERDNLRARIEILDEEADNFRSYRRTTADIFGSLSDAIEKISGIELNSETYDLLDVRPFFRDSTYRRVIQQKGEEEAEEDDDASESEEDK